MGIRPDDSRSPYLQITDDLRRAIALGDIAPGEQIPSTNDLKATYGVANQTVQNAINTLKSEGLVYGVPGRGTFVHSEVDADELLATLAAAESESPAYNELLAQVRSIGQQIAVINARLDAVEQQLEDGDSSGSSKDD